MIVTFISECHGRAINETRKVLDAYAHRIGVRTWQTVITEQGLDAVRSRLSRKARKNTAVACHRVRGTKRIELLWIVGNRRRFDRSGRVPVHRTARDIIREDDENDWHYLPLMRALVGIAALFHDFGKAWQPFQSFLMVSKKDDTSRDPWRHEWVSTLIFKVAAQSCEPRDFADLMVRLSEEPNLRPQLSQQWIDSAGKLAIQKNPLDTDHFGWQQWIEWLIVSHHRLPGRKLAESQGGLRTAADIFGSIKVTDNYEKLEHSFNAGKHWKFEYGIPTLSQKWCEQAAAAGRHFQQWLDTHGEVDLLSQREFNRPMLILSRVALMVGDHEFSSKLKSDWKTDYRPIANTIGRWTSSTEDKLGLDDLSGTPRQHLDEHLIGVQKHADRIVRFLPTFESELAWVEQIRTLRKPSRGRFAWQSKAVAKIREERGSQSTGACGFFGLNMASTGRGKTLANAKIMDALQIDKLRFSLALGLRTLTLQTGHQYRDQLKLHDSELAVLVGSSAVVKLDDQRQAEKEKEDAFGSDSSEDFAGSLYISFEDAIPDDDIETVIENKKAKQLLKAPILVCTIDHLMSAVEGTCGNAQPLPLLRLLSSDLVIDEVDEFDVLDMPAIARLVHLVGMLGRRLLLSSATITPSIAEGLFAAYRSGYSHHAAFRNRQPDIQAFWVDEYNCQIQKVPSQEDYATVHRSFVDKRIGNLRKETDIRQKARVTPIGTSKPVPSDCQDDVEASRISRWHQTITDEMVSLHNAHAWQENETDRRVSIGVIRVANVDPCIDLTRFLLEASLPDDYELRVVCYHARQVLLLRSEVERHLDRLLHRGSGRSPATDPMIISHLRRTKANNVLFVVVATPAAEIGRDHDYDWAVVEPSSMRSIIQLAGRVRRHRDGLQVDQLANVALLDYNRRAYVKQSSPAFKWPGFEGMQRHRAEHCLLKTHQLCKLIDVEALSERLNSVPRVHEAPTLYPTDRLTDLEHRVLRSVMTDENFGAAFIQGWCQSDYWLTDVAQMGSRFRASRPQSQFRLYVDDDDILLFRIYDPKQWSRRGELPASGGHLVSIDSLESSLRNRLWMPLDYGELIDQQCRRSERSRRRECEAFGELRVDGELGERSFCWVPELGARSI